jgi:hypothetical protein
MLQLPILALETPKPTDLRQMEANHPLRVSAVQGAADWQRDKAEEVGAEAIRAEAT